VEGQTPGSAETGSATLPIAVARSGGYSAAASLVTGPGVGGVGLGAVLNRPAAVRVLLRDSFAGRPCQTLPATSFNST